MQKFDQINAIIINWTHTDSPPEFLKTNYNIYIRRYMRYYRLSLLDKQTSNYESAFHNILYFYRIISMQSFFNLDEKSWDLLLDLAIDIQQQIITDKPNLFDSISFSQRNMSTLLIICIRSKSQNPIYYQKLESVIKKNVNIKHYLKAWMVFYFLSRIYFLICV